MRRPPAQSRPSAIHLDPGGAVATGRLRLTIPTKMQARYLSSRTNRVSKLQKTQDAGWKVTMCYPDGNLGA